MSDDADSGDTGRFGGPEPEGDAGRFGGPEPEGDAGRFGAPEGEDDVGRFGAPDPDAAGAVASGLWGRLVRLVRRLAGRS